MGTFSECADKEKFKGRSSKVFLLQRGGRSYFQTTEASLAWWRTLKILHRLLDLSIVLNASSEEKNVSGVLPLMSLVFFQMFKLLGFHHLCLHKSSLFSAPLKQLPNFVFFGILFYFGHQVEGKPGCTPCLYFFLLERYWASANKADLLKCEWGHNLIVSVRKEPTQKETRYILKILP